MLKTIVTKFLKLLYRLLQTYRKKGLRLGIKDMKSYEFSFIILNRKSNTKGDRAWQVEKARNMYKEMSPETHEFFEFASGDPLDLDSKKGKAGGGYCTFIRI